MPALARPRGQCHEARRLLAEAGYASGFKTILTNRSIKLPYIDMGVT
jgi:hypothetical protein